MANKQLWIVLDEQTTLNTYLNAKNWSSLPRT